MAHHHHTHQSSKNLRLAFFLNVGFTILEIFGGIFTNSVAILSDALHDFGDSLSLGVSWYLDKKARKKADKNYTYGYRRFSLLGALINSMVLIVGSVFIISEAIQRIMQPEISNAKGMVVFALIGVTVNGYAAWKLRSGKSLNEKVVSWHLIEDVLGWVAVLVVAIVLLFKNVPYLDPVLSLVITLYVLVNVIKRLKETLFVFLQGKPTDLNLDEIEERLLQMKGISSLHHTHLWSLDGEHHVFTTHAVLNEVHSFQDILNIKAEIAKLLAEYPISHHTIETELHTESCSLVADKE